jgi:trimeric autotransporter adhesin
MIRNPLFKNAIMRGTLPLAACALGAALAGHAAPAAAQSDILLQARSGAPSGDRFRVDSAGGLVSMGSLGTGVIPASGAGIRMMWHPFKAAFRAGSTDGGLANDYWDDANVGFFSWAGGTETTAYGIASFAMGSNLNVTGNNAAAVGFGATVSGTAGFSAGALNSCSGSYCMAMGYTAAASGLGSVALGYNVTADASHAMALGQRASAGGQSGSFTWADASTTSVFANNTVNSFQIRAAGGVRLYTNATATAGMSLGAGGSSWIVLSDRTRKHDFAELEGEDVLARIRAVPVSSWRYIDELGDVRHIGPMAQDWHAAFGLSADTTTINMSDLDGVNLAAAQALERRTADLRTQLADRDARIESLEARVADMQARLARLEALLQADHPQPAAP